MAKRKILDAAMVLLLPLLMAYSLIGEAFHEVVGSCPLLSSITASRVFSSSRTIWR